MQKLHEKTEKKTKTQQKTIVELENLISLTSSYILVLHRVCFLLLSIIITYIDLL